MRKVSAAEINERQAKVEAEREEANAMQTLRETDWHVIRHLETGAPIPADVTAQRAKARAKAQRDAPDRE